MEKKHIISQIEKIFDEYTVIVCKSNKNERFLRRIVNLIKKRGLKVKILVECDSCFDIPEIMKISHEVFDYIVNLYNMYEFTNKIIVFSDETMYPSTINYFSQGILSENEIIEALLYNVG